MLSCLAQGVGSLNGDVAVDLENLKGQDLQYTLPPVVMTKYGPIPAHRHGITVSPRVKSAQSSTRSEKSDGELLLPKTFCTRRGALLLFTAPEKVPGLTQQEREFIREKMKISSMQDLSQKIGTLHRLTKSVLMYGDDAYEREDTSISDHENRIILKFLHGLDERAIDMRAQPGGDFGSYLRDVKSRASSTRASSVAPGVRFDDNVSVSTIEDGPKGPSDLLTASSDRLTEGLRPASSVTSRRSFKGLSVDRLTASLKSTGHLESPTPSTGTRQSLDDVLVDYRPTRIASAQPRRRRRPPPERRVGSGNELRQGRKRSDEEPTVKGEHRKQQLKRRQKKLSQGQGQENATKIQGQNGIQVEKATGAESETKDETETLKVLDECIDPLAESIPEDLEEDSLKGVETRLSSHDSFNNLPRDKNHQPQDEQTQIFDKKRSSVGSVQKKHSIVSQDPSGISSVVIRQPEGIITDHPDLGPAHQDGEVIFDDDQISVASSVLEEQDIDLPSDEDSKSVKSPNLHELDEDKQTLESLFSGGRKEKRQQSISEPKGEKEENLDQKEEHFDGESELDVQTQIEKDNDRHEGADILEEDEIYDDDDDENYEDEDFFDDNYDDGEEYDEYEEDGYDYQAGDDATQPLMPKYTGTLFSRGASFSFDNTLAETQNLDDIVIDESAQMLPHTIDSMAGSRPGTGAQEESASEAPSPTAPPPSPPGFRMSAPPPPPPTRATPGKTSPDRPLSNVSRTLDKRSPSQASGADKRPQSQASGASLQRTSSQASVGSRSGSQAGSGSGRGSAQMRPGSKARMSMTVDLPEMPAETFDSVAQPSSSRSTPVEELVPPEYMREHQFPLQTGDKDSDVARTIDSGIGGTEVSRQSTRVDSILGRSDGSNLLDSPVPSAAQINVKLPTQTEDEHHKEMLDKILSQSSPKPDSPADVTKAIGISSQATKLGRPSSSSSRRPSIPKHLLESANAGKKKRLDIEAEKAKVNKLEKEVDAILVSDVDNKYEEGMTVEELELEQKILEEKLKQAEEKVSSGGKDDKVVKKSRFQAPVRVNQKQKGKPKVPTKEQDLEAQRKAIQEQKAEEKKKRLEEALKLQEKIMEKEVSKKKELEEAAKKTRDIEDQMAELAEEAADAEQLEEEAKLALIASRRSAREEREIRRKQEQERRRNEASEKRQKEYEMMERAKKKEMEMLAKIKGVDAQRKLQEEERLRREEQEWAEQDQLEEEERLAKIAAEEEEKRIAIIEAQAEEEALARLRWERDEAERKRRQLMIKAEKLAEEEELKRQAFLEEQRKADEERRKIEEEANRKKEEERQRLMQLKKMEEEAREKMRLEFDKRRDMLLKRREKNLEARNHLQGIRTSQGMTRPWVFSYYVLWPRDTYERLIGGEDDKKKKGMFRRKPKSAK